VRADLCAALNEKKPQQEAADASTVASTPPNTPPTKGKVVKHEDPQGTCRVREIQASFPPGRIVLKGLVVEERKPGEAQWTRQVDLIKRGALEQLVLENEETSTPAEYESKGCAVFVLPQERVEYAQLCVVFRGITGELVELFHCIALPPSHAAAAAKTKERWADLDSDSE